MRYADKTRRFEILTKTYYFIPILQDKKSHVHVDVNLAASHCDDWTMWTDETSGMYRWYMSIGEEGSVRLTKAMFAIAPYLCNLWNKACIANRTSLTLVLLVHGLNKSKGALDVKCNFIG